MRLGWVVLVALALVACGDDDGEPMVDAGADAGTDAGPPDSGPPPMSTLFGPCVADSQCPGEGAFCRTPDEGWPEGSCTLPCVDRTPCDDGVVFNLCLEDPDDASRNICQQKCLNAQDCGRENYVCVGRTDTRDGICIGYCSDDADCGEGAECNVWSAQCVAAGTAPTAGAETGGACASDADCLSGTCLSPGDGWTGGYCLGACILPVGYNSNTFCSGDALPTEQCPGGDVCYPNDSLARDNAGVCLDACTTDADCRVGEGYYCRRSVELTSGDTKTFTNGVCWPSE